MHRICEIVIAVQVFGGGCMVIGHVYRVGGSTI